MAYDEVLAGRVRAQLGRLDGLSEKRMFGGLAFLLSGIMCCGVNGDDLIVRLAPEQTDDALSRAYTRVFDLTGRPMRGWLLVQPGGLETEAELVGWVRMAVEYASTLSAKK